MGIKRPYIFLGGLLLILFTFVQPVFGQRVNFGLHAGQGITLTVMTPDQLDFGNIVSGEGTTKNILLNDPEAVPIAIEGIAYLDVTVTITPPDNNRLALMGDTENLSDNSKSIPVTIYMAYSNKGGSSEAEFKAAAIEVTGNMITFQIKQRPGGPPGPPPIPPHGNYTPPVATAYLFIYGGVTVGTVNAGPYSGTIDIHVEYSTYIEPD